MAVAQVFGGVEFDLLEAHDLAHHLDLAVLDDDLPPRPLREGVDDPDVGEGHGVGEVIHLDLSDVGGLPLQVELVDMVLLGLDHIDRVVVDGGEGAVPVHLGDDPVVPGVRRIHDNHILRIDAPEAHLVGGIALGRPVPAGAGAVENPLPLKVIEQLLQVFPAEALPLLEGELEGGALDVVQEDQQVVRIDPAELGGAGKKVIGVLHDELVQGGAAGDEEGQALARAPPRPPGLLPGAGDGAGIAAEDRRLQVADVDPQLQGVRRHDPHHLAAAQACLDLPAEVGEVSPAVARDELGVHGLPLCEPVLQVLRQDLDVQAAGGENDRLDVVLDEFRGHLPNRRQGGLADAELPVDDGRVVEDEGLGRRRRPALGDERHGTLQEPLRVLLRVRHRGGTADEDRVPAVEAADPDETAQDVRHVGAEDPPVDVEFVDDHILEVREELLPLRMVGEDPGVEHVGVRDNDVALPADRLPGVVGGVPVVGVCLDIGLELADQAVDLVHLVLGEGLRREEVEGAGFRLFEDLLQNRQVVAEGLAARRRGDEDDA